MPHEDAQVALVTGGARGLGIEICRQLAQAGMVVWCAARDPERAERVADSLRGDGEVRAAQLDVADEQSISALADRLDGHRHGRWRPAHPGGGAQRDLGVSAG